ncbi:MAG: hypothetical protein CL920_34365 [Deltaproteobacteria bacterium]|nr:hypothetical protein [Deltaproteobacteria bacterium]MBU53809.1 hypothetical protein [Deltaproteobacteria bacterium]|tara:strand:- start:3638 stop:4291 length:654 start_codon:yes stop_codon:yes gene_type:complete
MRIGILSDIHADPVALCCAIRRLLEHHVHRIVCLGDLVDKGPDDEGVIDTIRQYCISTVQGNHDEAAIIRAEGRANVSDGDWERVARSEKKNVLSPAYISFLRSLPVTRWAIWEGKRVLMTHDGLGVLGFSLDQFHPPKAYKKMLKKSDADVVLMGHTHIPTASDYGGIRLLNPGSVCHKRARDSHTVGVLTLPSMDFEVYAIDSGRAQRTRDIFGA